ncbi:hypothetical protein EJ05DRAFT_496480 [Pseudovirgaria hyperparasitica]|uniref:Uncharacterized protein n=1 Tax=Pseudovirgaria hyperparasitica TaxID=470096 RepID=A0A6A6WFQ4_9PEZI|nr:uncharacterized protein EJ05DRAFT_496480 [Pseudovirgaria hyperparasitica]KAF2761573.1 hypothetical protein EJ05DRAFT_496480 [Pseudovirgaria hyperparasitica]
MARSQSRHGKGKAIGMGLHWVFNSKEPFMFYMNALKDHHQVLDISIAMKILGGSQTYDREGLGHVRLDLQTSLHKQIVHEQNNRNSVSTALTLLSAAPESDQDCNVADTEMTDQNPVRYLDFDLNKNQMCLQEYLRGLYRKSLRIGSVALSDSAKFPRTVST